MHQNSKEELIQGLVEEKIADREDLFFVDVSVLSNGKVEILVDGDQGVNIDDCADISRFVGFHLEEKEVFSGPYRLEVSSPGVGKPLKLHRQYLKNIGRKIKVLTTEGEELQGTLLVVEEDRFEMEYVYKEKRKKAEVLKKYIAFEQVKETKVQISFK